MWNNTISSNLVGLWDYHSKWSKLDNDRQTSYDIPYMWNLIKKVNKWAYLQNINGLTAIESNLRLQKGKCGG